MTVHINKYATQEILKCGDDVTILKGLKFNGCDDNRIIRFVDCHGQETDFFKSTLNICVEGNCPSDCNIPEDYRSPNNVDTPHVVVHGHTRNCNQDHEHDKISVFPQYGQSIEDLFCFLLDCVNT